MQAEASTLRRLERDLHDGPQQRLVRLTMDLEATSRRLDDDPDKARPLLDEAIAQSREALAELRALSRGHRPAGARRPRARRRARPRPPRAAPSRSPSTSPCPGACPPRSETTAYFVVTEALTNVAKHAAATRATVTAASTTDRLVV